MKIALENSEKKKTENKTNKQEKYQTLSLWQRWNIFPQAGIWLVSGQPNTKWGQLHKKKIFQPRSSVISSLCVHYAMTF